MSLRRNMGVKIMELQDINSVVRINTLQWNTHQRTLMVRDKVISLTKIEYKLLFVLRHGIPVTYEDVAYTVYNCDIDKRVRVVLDKHVDRIRDKLQDTGLYLYCVLDYGYVLLPRKGTS